MTVTRRNVLAGAAALPLASGATASVAKAQADAVPSFPDRVNFLPRRDVYLDNGSTHPVTRMAREAADKWVARRAGEDVPRGPRGEEGAQAKFARLINAEPEEIAYVQSTTTGEQMVVAAMGLPEKGAHIVTDTLHFFGSFPMYEEMEKAGCAVTWVRHREDGSIALEDYAKAIRPGTKLVALSLVATYNGFLHDLKAICDIAHAAGAMVYADIIHAAGSIPVDVKDSGVDFACCSTYKWLMGDFGLAFLYARKSSMEKLSRSFYGYYGMAAFKSHVYPLDRPGETVADYSFREDATGFFSLGTYNHMAEEMVKASLDYLLATDPARIQAYGQTLMAPLREELPKMGYPLFTPIDTPTPFATFVVENAGETLGKALREAGISTTCRGGRLRVTSSVHNSMDDIEFLIETVRRASA